MEIRYLTPESVVEINRQQIERYTPAEPHGVLNHNALESAMMRGQMVHHYDPEADIFQIVGAIGYGLNKAHAFVNANKRTAMHVTMATLLLNGYLLKTDAKTGVIVCVQVATNMMTEEKFSGFLRDCSIRYDLDEAVIKALIS